MARKKPQIIKDSAGKPEYVVIEYQEYLRLIDEIEDPEGLKRSIELADKRYINDEETVPAEKVFADINKQFENQENKEVNSK